MPRLGNFLKTKLSRKAEGATLAHWRGGGWRLKIFLLWEVLHWNCRLLQFSRLGNIYHGREVRQDVTALALSVKVHRI